MTKAELSAALKLALTKENLSNENIDHFDGFGLRDFQPTTCTIKQLARLIRWQCFCLDGSIDQNNLNEIAFHGKKRFVVI